MAADKRGFTQIRQIIFNRRLSVFMRGYSGFGLMVLLSFGMQAQTCSNASYSGAYAYLLNGTVTSSTGSLTPYAQLGNLAADGMGNVSGQAMESKGGTISRLVLSGTYTVNADCSGTQTFNVTPQSASPYTFVSSFQFVQGGQQALVATSTPGMVLTGESFRSATQGGNPCGAASLSGSYGILGLSPPLGTTLPYSNVGGVTFDGKGAATFKFAVNDSNTGVSTVTSSGGSGTYSVGGNCFGTAFFTIGPGNVVTDTFDIVEGGSVLLLETDPGTLFSGVMQPQSVGAVLPQFVFGGGWYSALYFSNTTSGIVTIPVNFTADDGTPMTVLPLGNSGETVTISAKGSAIIEAPNVGPLTQGYAGFNLPPGVSAYGVFRQSVVGVPDQEAVVPVSSASSSLSTLGWDDTNYVTSVAVVNTGANGATITITLSDNNGTFVGTSSLALDAHHKTEATLRSLPGLAGMIGKRGTAQFTTSVGSVAVLGLRFNGAAFTSIPATQQ